MTRFPECVAAVLLAAAACSAAPTVVAPAPAPRIVTIMPAALRPGESAVVTLGGANLAAFERIAVAQPRGVTIRLVDGHKPDAISIGLQVDVAQDAPLGDRELRFIGPGGASNPLPLTITQLPLVNDAEPNPNGPAQKVKLPVLIAGRIDATGDVDAYPFEARKGQRLVFNVLAERIGSPLDSLVALVDDRGREIASSNNAVGADALMIATIPADGAYTLEVRDLQYRGGVEYAYRVEAGELPYVHAVYPSAGLAGSTATVQLVGENLGGGESTRIDLTKAAPGPIDYRARIGAWWSNATRFTASDLPQAMEIEPNDAAARAQLVKPPVMLHGRVDRPGDTDRFAFHNDRKQRIAIEGESRAFDSPVNLLLTLHDAAGKVVRRVEDNPAAPARLAEMLAPGDYTLSVQDLVHGGSPAHAYRLSIQPQAQPTQDFAVRFIGDAPRVSRGSHTAMWCEVIRSGFNGEVTLSLQDPPRGVYLSGARFTGKGSGVFILSASADAALGTHPLTILATGTLGNQKVTRVARAELSNRLVEQPYVTVLDKPAFAVSPLSSISDKMIAEHQAELQKLTAKLGSDNPDVIAAAQAWEKSLARGGTQPGGWTILTPTAMEASGGVTLKQLPDGSILAGGRSDQATIYTLTMSTRLTDIKAVRLEAMTDPSLPAKGPGRSGGNFVLSHLALTAGPIGKSDQQTTVEMAGAVATFSQSGFDVGEAIASKPLDSEGWAVSPQTGKAHTAVFTLKQPVGLAEGTQLTFRLNHVYKRPGFALGRFRISVTTTDGADLHRPAPQEIVETLAVAAKKRTSAQRKLLTDYFVSIAPQHQADRERMAMLRTIVGPRGEIAQLQKKLTTQTSELDAALLRWERTVGAGVRWVAIEPTEVKSLGGAKPERLRDGSIVVRGPAPATDTYIVTGTTKLKTLRAVRLEVLPDKSLPGGGPGRSANGNFVLTTVGLKAGPKGSSPLPVELHMATQEMAQANFPASGALDSDVNTGWAVLPHAGKKNAATFRTKSPASGGDEGTSLVLTLEHKSKYAQHTLGSFRIYVTSDPVPEIETPIPAAITAIVRTATDKRTDAQRAQLAAYFRTIAPTLEPMRKRLAQIKAQLAADFPPKLQVRKTGSLAVLVHRAAGYDGEVSVTLEGFSSGRNSATGQPETIGKSLKVTAGRVRSGDATSSVGFEATPRSETGTRTVVLKATGKVGSQTLTEYSQPFELSVLPEKKN